MADTTQLSPVAQLQTIHLSLLKRKSHDERSRLVEAAKLDGMFYLDLDGDGCLSETVKDMDRMSRSLFDLSEEEKMMFDVDGLGKYRLDGYKPVGRDPGGMWDGDRDGFESYAVSFLPLKRNNHNQGKTTRYLANALFSITDRPIPQPDILKQYQQTLQILTSTCTDLTDTIMVNLSAGSPPEDEDSFYSCYCSLESSFDIIHLLKYPKATGSRSFSIPQREHTTLASITFPFRDSPGLQIFQPDFTEWEYVLPRKGQPIVTFGDAMEIFSDEVFCSSRRRVVSLERDREEVRYGFELLVRPDPKQLMAPLSRFTDPSDVDGRFQTCEKWLDLKLRELRCV